MGTPVSPKYILYTYTDRLESCSNAVHLAVNHEVKSNGANVGQTINLERVFKDFHAAIMAGLLVIL